MNKRAYLSSLVGCLLLLVALAFNLSPSTAAPEQVQGAPTLVPPTLVPTIDAGMTDVLLSTSGVAGIQDRGVVRVGILFNAPPFGELSIRGDVIGYDADLARSLAELWGIELQLVQVTRQTAIEMLYSGEVDLLIAAQVHSRAMDMQVEFSQTYHIGRQVMMVRADDPAAAPTDFGQPGNPRRIGVVLRSPGEAALQAWQSRTGLQPEVTSYYSLDQALTALLTYQVDAVVESRTRLSRAILQPDAVRILDEPVAQEPYAVVVRRQDAPLRDLVNRSLQYLVNNGRMAELHNAYFPETTYPTETLTVWANIGDSAPQPAQFPTTITYPTSNTVPRLQAERVLRVTGIPEIPPDATESERRLANFYTALVNELANRWEVSIQLVPGTGDAALEAVHSGMADLAAGVLPDWNWADRVDFTEPYLLHGFRLLVRSGDGVENLTGLRGETIAVLADDAGARETLIALADDVDVSIDIATLAREEDAAFAMLSDEANPSVEAVFGDSLRLQPHLEANPDTLRYAIRCDLCEPWYSRYYLVFAVPDNDLDFRLLVDYTLQETVLDGSFATLSAPVMLPNENPLFDIWPGSNSFLGFMLLRRAG